MFGTLFYLLALRTVVSPSNMGEGTVPTDQALPMVAATAKGVKAMGGGMQVI